MHVHVIKRSLVKRKKALDKDEGLRLNERMRERLGFLREALSGTDIGYVRRLIAGDTAEDIKKLMEEARPDMVIVGRHSSWISRHARVWQMLAQFIQLGKAPVLVVPPLSAQSHQH